MRVERYTGRRNRPPNWMIGLGCLLTAAFGVIVFCAGLYTFGLFTPLILQLAGIDRIGETDDVFANAQPAAVPVVQDAVNPAQVTVNLGEYGELDLDSRDFTVTTGSGAGGAPLATASFTEPSLLALCNQRSTVCSGSDGRYRNAGIDLRSGGAIIYADVNIGSGLWQRVGVVLRLDASRTRFDLVGVDIEDVLYDPASAPGGIGDSVDEIEATGNDVLRQVALETGGQNYALSEVIIDDTTLTLVMR